MIMRKTYTTPTLEIVMIETDPIMQDLVITSGSADGSNETLTHEDKDWNIWSEDEE